MSGNRFIPVPECVLKVEGLTAYDCLVAGSIYKRTTLGNKNDRYIKIEWITAELNIHSNTVSKSIRNLIDHAVIKSIRTPRGYRFSFLLSDEDDIDENQIDSNHKISDSQDKCITRRVSHKVSESDPQVKGVVIHNLCGSISQKVTQTECSNGDDKNEIVAGESIQSPIAEPKAHIVEQSSRLMEQLAKDDSLEPFERGEGGGYAPALRQYGLASGRTHRRYLPTPRLTNEQLAMIDNAVGYEKRRDALQYITQAHAETPGFLDFVCREYSKLRHRVTFGFFVTLLRDNWHEHWIDPQEIMRAEIAEMVEKF